MASRPGSYNNPIQPAGAPAVGGTTPVYPYYYPNTYPIQQKPRSKKKHHKSKKHHSKKHHEEQENEKGVVRKVGHHLKEHKWRYLAVGAVAGGGYWWWSKRKENEKEKEREEGYYERERLDSGGY